MQNQSGKKEHFESAEESSGAEPDTPWWSDPGFSEPEEHEPEPAAKPPPAEAKGRAAA
jgi:hypothetical protein